jgi:hypothetical protein
MRPTRQARPTRPTHPTRPTRPAPLRLRFSSPAALALVALIPLGPLVACTKSAPPPTAPVDVTIGKVPDAGQLVISPPPPSAERARSGDMCTATLHAGRIAKLPTCTLDEKISSTSGTLRYPCEGDGEAEAVFDDQRFDGSVKNDVLTLTIITEPDWRDGCDWESHQVIQGSIKHGKLSWRLAEHIVRDTGSCYGACTATATIDVVGAAGADEQDEKDAP